MMLEMVSLIREVNCDGIPRKRLTDPLLNLVIVDHHEYQVFSPDEVSWSHEVYLMFKDSCSLFYIVITY